MQLHIRTWPRLHGAAVAGAQVTAPVGTSPVPTPRVRSRPDPDVGSSMPLLGRWHPWHRWELTPGDDAHQLAFGCTVCGRTRRTARTSTAPRPVADAELRRMR